MAADLSLPVLIPADLTPDADPIRQTLLRFVPWLTHGDPFSEQMFGAGPWSDQGWKLHVSATALSAMEVLERTLPILLAEGVRFKAVNAQQRMLWLNGGSFGESQVGKFITVYPSDDAQAVRLAVALDEATRGLAGPRVPTDRPLRPGSLVHYRYGAYRTPRDMLPQQGERLFTVYDMLDPAGRLANDYRLNYYLPPPPEIRDPFEAAGVVEAPERRAGPFAGRYLIHGLLDRSVRGGVFRAVDLQSRPARVCLLKEFSHDVGTDRYGRDARFWGESEAEILSAHDGDPLFPRLYDRFEMDGNLYLAIEYVDGAPLDKLMPDHGPDSDIMILEELAVVGSVAADLLARLHEAGIIFRDFKPGNLIRTPEGGYRLIDFGLAYAYRTDRRQPIATGTPPYFPTEQLAGEHPDPADDVYAWGAVMHHLACGRQSIADQPQGMDQVKPFPRRPARELRPSLPASMADIIDRAVAMERAGRYATMAEVRDAWAAAAADRPSPPQPPSLEVCGDPPADPAEGNAGRGGSTVEEPAARLPLAQHWERGLGGEGQQPDFLALAREVGDALCDTAVQHQGGLCWVGRSESMPGDLYSPDLYDGVAGIALFLAELAQETGDDRYAEAARGAARWLGGATWGYGRAMPGLQCGEAGVGWFFLRLAALLNEPGYLAAAELRARRLAGTPFQTLDLLYGAAGTVLFLVHLAEATGNGAHLAYARQAGDVLLAAAQPAPGGQGRLWQVPGATPALPPTPYLGLGHGAAGIGLALAGLGGATGDERYLAGARDAAELLLAEATPGEADGWHWRRVYGEGPLQLAAHCHGATGIGQFFVRLARVLPDSRYVAAARHAASGVAAHVPSKIHSGICHGIAGDGAFFLDCHRALGDDTYLDLARDCAGRLTEFRDPERTGVYHAHRGGFTTPDLFIGYAGVGSFFLRLGAGRPDLILP